jgi:hypothetical protein
MVNRAYTVSSIQPNPNIKCTFYTSVTPLLLPPPPQQTEIDCPVQGEVLFR